MVSTHLKNISQIGNLPQIGVNIKYLKSQPSHSMIDVCIIPVTKRSRLLMQTSLELGSMWGTHFLSSIFVSTVFPLVDVLIRTILGISEYIKHHVYLHKIAMQSSSHHRIICEFDWKKYCCLPTGDGFLFLCAVKHDEFGSLLSIMSGNS